jgi:hypothetical protein
MSDDYSVRVEGIEVVDGVEVDIEVRGDEDRAENVLLDLKDRLGYIAHAYDIQQHPDAIVNRPEDKRPLMTVDWGQVMGFKETDADE